MIKKCLRIRPNGQKSPQNVKIMQKKYQKWQKMGEKRHKSGPKMPNYAPKGRPPFPATLRPISKTSGAYSLRSLTAPLVFSVGFGNIFVRPRPRPRRVEKRKGENRPLPRGSWKYPRRITRESKKILTSFTTWSSKTHRPETRGNSTYPMLREGESGSTHVVR